MLCALSLIHSSSNEHLGAEGSAMNKMCPLFSKGHVRQRIRRGGLIKLYVQCGGNGKSMGLAGHRKTC